MHGGWKNNRESNNVLLRIVCGAGRGWSTNGVKAPDAPFFHLLVARPGRATTGPKLIRFVEAFGLHEWCAGRSEIKLL